MKKLFISCPMKGRSNENINKSFEFMQKYAELMVGEDLDVIDSFIEDDPPKGAKESVFYLGESIKKMCEADYVVGIGYSDQMWAGCSIEEHVARAYGIPYIEINWRNAKCFEDCVELERHRWDEAANTVCPR